MSKGLFKWLPLAAIVFISACDRPVKLAETTAPASDSVKTTVSPIPSREIIPENDAANPAESLPLLSKQYAAQSTFQTFSGKAKVHYEGKGQSQDFNANIRIEKDKKIWLSINALGLLEVFRAILSTDSLEAINRLDKTYYQFPLSEASRILPVAADFQTVQSLLTGGIIGQHGQVVQVLDKGQQHSVIVQQKDFQQTLVLSENGDQLLQQNIYNPEAGLRLEAQYQQQHLIGDRQFPFQHQLGITTPDGSVRLEINYDRVTFNEPVEMPFSIPRKFKKAKMP